MILKPGAADFKTIGFYTGKVIVGIGLLMLVPLACSLAFGEWNPAIEFLIGIGACLLVGLALETACRTDRDLNWSQGLVVASFSWILATVLGAIPHWLSGHFGSYLDAMFDIMSGYTTTGLFLLQDLDHISHGLNMWRHLLTYAGGQGIVVIALTFLFQGTPGAYKVYVGEGKDERLLPNVINTARAIWLVSVGYLVVGATVLWGLALRLGQAPGRAFLHALWMFMGGWSTGGFAPQSYNALYYHSAAFELVLCVIFIAGSLNFALHWALWTGNRGEIRKNIEVLSFFITMTVAMTIVTAGLMRLGVYPDLLASLRKMFFQVASGHTTTGFGTIYSRAFVRQWGPLAMLGVTLAMAVGASACSTAGGIKGLRVGIVFHAFSLNIRKIIFPERAVIVRKWHHVSTRVLDERTVNAAMIIVISYILTYAVGGLVGVLCGYEPVQAIFDSVSAASNTGLSCGVTSPGMPVALKITYILQMWAGRLEFMSIYVLGGFIVSIFKGR